MHLSVIYIPGWPLHIDLYSQPNNGAVGVITPGVVLLDLQVVGTIECHKHKGENLSRVEFRNMFFTLCWNLTYAFRLIQNKML